jgi:hypothetical protein
LIFRSLASIESGSPVHDDYRGQIDVNGPVRCYLWGILFIFRVMDIHIASTHPPVTAALAHNHGRANVVFKERGRCVLAVKSWVCKEREEKLS